MTHETFQVIGQLSTGIALLNHDLAIEYLNESAESLLNASFRRARHQALGHLVQDDGQLIEACRRVLEDGGQLVLRDHEVRLPAMGNVTTVNFTVGHLDLEAGDRLLLELNASDLNTRILRDEEFTQRQQSNQAVIRGMAHEIRNPLGGIRGAAQLLAEEAGGQGFAEYTRIIIQEADRLSSLVNRMQASAQADLDQVVNIHRAIEHVRNLLEVESDGRLEICQDYDPSLPRVRGNRDLLIQALLNVMRNAMESVATIQGQARINLRTRIDHIAPDGHRKQVVRVDIEDNGPGIEPAIEGRIFDPMVTGKPGGTGLGLPITAEIITQHGGALNYSSRPGETIFHLYLPVARGMEA